MRYYQLWLLLFLLLLQPFAYGMENVFYIMHDKRQEALSSLAKYHDPAIIVAQAYHIDKAGVVTGNLDSDILSFTQHKPIKLMAMVTNSSFDSAVAHQFLSNKKAQDKAIQTIVNECDKYHLYGIQFDFEMIKLADKAGLTHFYQAAAAVLHKKNYKVSFAVAPVVADFDFPSFYQKRLYEVWQGAYDLKALAPVSDFITVMSYDQHGQGTTPGPAASIKWDEQIIKHILKSIPAAKLSLGVPVYSSFWYLDTDAKTKRISVRYSSVSYEKAQQILKKFNAYLIWDDIDKVNYTFYEYYWMNKFMFIEDARSFRYKLDLAKKYHLKGVSIFRLGIEDPKIWSKF